MNIINNDKIKILIAGLFFCFNFTANASDIEINKLQEKISNTIEKNIEIEFKNSFDFEIESVLQNFQRENISTVDNIKKDEKFLNNEKILMNNYSKNNFIS